MHAGIDPKFMPMPQSGANEKGGDVALAIDAMQVGLEGHVDVAVLVTGDADFVPLVRALIKQGISMVAAYFEYQEGEHKSFINERLLNVCNYVVNMNDMEKDKDFKAMFTTLSEKLTITRKQRIICVKFKKRLTKRAPDGAIAPKLRGAICKLWPIIFRVLLIRPAGNANR